jgi:hypothetical protein
MGDVGAALRRYVNEKLRLSMSDMSIAAKSRKWFFTRIRNEIESRTREPQLCGSQRFVEYGSYFKGTKVEDVDEFDALVVIDSCGGIFTSGGDTIGTGQGSACPNHKYNPAYRKADGSGVSPRLILLWLFDVVQAVTAGFDGEVPDCDGQVVTATIKSRNFKVDLAPAGVFKHASSGRVFYNIPAGGHSDGWTLTDPRGDIDRLNSVAGNKDDFKSVIRLLKRLNDNYALGLSSFAIETAVVDFGEKCQWENDTYLDTLHVLHYIATVLRGETVPDPFDPKKDLIGSVADRDMIANFLDRVRVVLQNAGGTASQEACCELVDKIFENEPAN